MLRLHIDALVVGSLIVSMVWLTPIESVLAAAFLASLKTRVSGAAFVSFDSVLESHAGKTESAKSAKM